MRLFATLRQQYLNGRFFPLLLLALLYLTASGITRLVLFFMDLHLIEAPLRSFFAIMAIGLFFDVVAAAYLLAPFALYLFALPQRLFLSRAHRLFILAMMLLTVFGAIYLEAAEYFFFDEFNSRFNFVAVEYLIYPHEVFVNIWESYPVGRVLLAAAALALAVIWGARRPLRASLKSDSRPSQRLQPLLLQLALAGGAYAAVDINSGHYSSNHVANELAQNGAYSFFYAALNNEMDYRQHYRTIAPAEAAQRLRRLVEEPGAEFIPNAADPIARHIAHHGEPKRLNVVVIVEESLGAEFVGAYGDTRGLTPNFDRLAQQGIVFSNAYATGTRTVQGLAAITSSFPPIPGEAIVKRPHNEHLFNWGQVMAQNGYTPWFIYGGYGTFDNMNYFFSHNGFKVTDRTDIDHPVFSNIWGVADEDLFRHAIQVLDAEHRRGGHFFSLIMTTSNHKPFTFPAGIPGIRAEGGGREMGVKYADYALGKFFEEVRTRPYFEDTLFVVVADHGARVYGREEIPLKSYEIPLLVYAPKHFQPRRVDILASQIDIAPTVLGLLDFSYDSLFFGRDVFAGSPDDKFVLLSHNRDVALYRDGHLSELGIKRFAAGYRYDAAGARLEKAVEDVEGIRDAVSIYQSGYDLFKNGQYRL